MNITTARIYSIVRPVNILLGLILIFYFINGVFYLRAQSVTFDEGSFIGYAARLVRGHPERIYPQTDNSKMPVIAINLIPRLIEQVFNPGLKKNDNGTSDVFAGRYITLLISGFVVLLTFFWSKKLYGEWAGVFSAFLISFCPGILANAGLVTTDCYSVLFLELTIFFLWKFCHNYSISDFIIFSVCIACSQLVKQSLTHLYIIAPILFLISSFRFQPGFRIQSVFKYIFIFIFLNWFIINSGYYFRDTNLALDQYAFVSKTFQYFQNLLPSWLPIPFPKAYISGLDLSKYYDQIGGGHELTSSFGKITILNKSSTGGSFWYYYLVSFLFKTPISSLIFIFSSFILLLKWGNRKSFLKNEIFLLAPVLYYGLYMSFFYKTQIGIRQFIFVYPFLFIMCGNLISLTGKGYIRYVIFLLSVFMIVAVLRYWKNYFPYTNELITDKKMAYQVVGSSNLEFNQSQFFFKEYLRQHPDVRMAPKQPAAGVFLIGLHDYMDVWNRHAYDWISHIPPSGQVAYNGLLITVTTDDLKILR